VEPVLDGLITGAIKWGDANFAPRSAAAWEATLFGRPVVIALLQLEAINRWRYYLADRSNEELAELITSLTEPGPSPEPDDSVDNDSVDNDARKGTAPIPRPPPPPPGPIGIVDFEFSMSTKSRGLNGSLNVRYTKNLLPLDQPVEPGQ
jgi:hypothetical protein